jgi:hypothetical protein
VEGVRVALRHVGSLTLGECVPMLLAANASLSASINLVLPSLQAKLAAALQLQASLTLTPPTLAGNLQVAIDLVASLQASVSLGLPGIDFQLAAVAQLIAAIDLELGALGVHISFAAELTALLGAAGIHAYTYTGQAQALAGELGAATGDGFPGGQPDDACAAWVFAATAPAAIEALGKVFVTGG